MLVFSAAEEHLLSSRRRLESVDRVRESPLTIPVSIVAPVEGRPYEIVSLADTVGVTEGPDRISRLVAQRERWQRVILESVFHYRGMLFRRRYGTVGSVGMQGTWRFLRGDKGWHKFERNARPA